MIQKKRKQLLLFRNIIWALVIFVLCAMPSEDISNPHWDIPHLDKVVHFGMFFIMAVLLCSELGYQTNLTQRKIYLITVTISLIYGGVIEILQQYFFNLKRRYTGSPGRCFRCYCRLFALSGFDALEK